MDAAYGGSTVTTYHNEPAGMAVPPVPVRKDAPKDARKSHRRRTPIGSAPLRVLRNDADGELREQIVKLRSECAGRLSARDQQRISDALRPERRPQTYLVELSVIFGRAGISRERLAAAFGGWLEVQLIRATPAPLTSPIAVVREETMPEFLEAVGALHAVAEHPTCATRLRVLTKEVGEALAKGRKLFEASVEAVEQCYPRRQGL